MKAAEIVVCRECEGRAEGASMRPRREGRGNDDGGRMGLVRRPASMRPRREGRGNLPRIWAGHLVKTGFNEAAA